ncbi:LRR receptor-like serine/threonine-protein kinase EFR [Ananas comosus]|uniref:non-specific serine/threonine protein kinase n=1 Tax=Ananas comosus TaxID=4615 RepID=A0A199UU75_ANACO|nr:LRR receptor-like serine/threonine-protein kinase EFR [Ananas comosus]
MQRALVPRMWVKLCFFDSEVVGGELVYGEALQKSRNEDNDNHFTGPIPDQIGSLTRLRVLNSSSNLLQGTIPPNLSACVNLKAVDLSANTILGTIPTTLWMLSKLQVLNLAQNQLTGPIPTSIGNLSSLNTLNLGTNTLSGPIPRELGHLKALEQLQLSINNLTGTVPSSLYNVSSLVLFALASNDLYGEVPSDIGFWLPKLLVFHNCFNQFTGTIPPSLHNRTKIQSIRMSHNHLVGSVPPGLDKLHDLTMYNIGFNRIVDTLDFVASLTNSTVLRYLAIDENLLSGTIPESIGDLSAGLSKLYIGGNRISGKIPASIGWLTSLTLLKMSHNLISGEISPEIGQLKQLRMFGLAGNRLSGEIPASLGNLSLITQLEMYENELVGRIPDSFSEFQLLLSLDLSSNHLEEAIPNGVFTLTSLTSLLNLSHNSLTGHLPQDIGMLGNLVVLDLSNNLLSGNITDSVGQCKSLQVLSMSNNSLSGLIPNSLGNLKGLQSLDLSSNRLVGSIPQSLEKLQALQLLNLSFNDLDGNVPKEGVFRNRSAVYLEDNPNLCFGLSSCDGFSPSHRRKMAVHTVVIITLAVFLFYGVMLLELVTGKSPTDESFVGGLSLEKWVRAAFPNRTAEVIDTELDVTNVIRSGACTISPEKQLMCLVSMIQIALCCVLESPETRSSMRDVLHQLESIKEALVKKPQIAVFSQREELKAKLRTVINDEAAVWKTRAKQHWLREGDGNTKFFHSIANDRRRANWIGTVVDNGVTYQSEEEKKSYFYRRPAFRGGSTVF